MQRNYGLDILKALLILLVIVIHICASYEVPAWNDFVQYLYAYASYSVPVFFIISGYYFYKSRNKEKNIINLIVLYVSLSIAYLCILFILLDVPIKDNLTEIFTLDKSAVGYLWFVKYLIYFHLIAYLVLGKNKIIKFVITIVLLINIILLFTNQIETTKFRYYNLIPYTCGILISKYDKYTNIKFLRSKLFLMPLILIPLSTGMENVAAQLVLYIFGVLIFIIFKNVEFKQNYISYISKNTIYILAFHGIMIRLIRAYSLTDDYRFVSLYIFTLLGAFIMLEIFKFVERKLIRRVYVK